MSTRTFTGFRKVNIYNENGGVWNLNFEWDDPNKKKDEYFNDGDLFNFVIKKDEKYMFEADNNEDVEIKEEGCLFIKLMDNNDLNVFFKTIKDEEYAIHRGKENMSINRQ